MTASDSIHSVHVDAADSSVELVLFPTASPATAASASADEQQLRRLVAGWLLGYSSPHTRRAYARDLTGWAVWCAARRDLISTATRGEFRSLMTDSTVGVISVLPTERLPDVARRVASRPPNDRHAPVVLCDEHARLVGLVTVERMIGRLTTPTRTRGWRPADTPPRPGWPRRRPT